MFDPFGIVDCIKNKYLQRKWWSPVRLLWQTRVVLSLNDSAQFNWNVSYGLLWGCRWFKHITCEALRITDKPTMVQGTLFHPVYPVHRCTSPVSFGDSCLWTGIANRPITPHDSINRAITHDRLVLSNVSSDDLSWWVTYNSSKHGFQPALTPAMYRAVFTTAMHRGPITVLVQLPGASAAKPHTPQTLATSVSSHRTARRMDCQHFVTRMAIRHNYQLGSRQ